MNQPPASDFAAFQALKGHYQRIQDYGSLLKLLESWATRSGDAQAASQAFFEAAELAIGHFAERDHAARLYLLALERNPTHADASARLEALYRMAQDPHGLADVLEHRREALEHHGNDPNALAAVHYQLGELCERSFQRQDIALNHYLSALEQNPAHRESAMAARLIYLAAGQIAPATTLYEHEIQLETDPHKQLTLFRELSALYVDGLQDLERGTHALKRALAVAPNDVTLMNQIALLLLRQAQAASSQETASRDMRAAAELFLQVAEVVPKEHARAYIESALDASPTHLGALSALERLVENTEYENILHARWVTFLQHAPDSPAAPSVRMRLAQAYDQAGQIPDAIECLEPLLGQGDPDAAQYLIDLYIRVGQEENAVRAMSVIMHGLPPDKRMPRLRGLMELLSARGHMDGAAASAREILAVDSSDMQAFTFLETYHRDNELFFELRELMLIGAEATTLSVHERKRRLQEAGYISESQLDDRVSAIAAWRKATALDPLDIRSIDELVRLLSLEQAWDEVIQLLERKASSSRHLDVQTSAWVEVARIYRDERRDLEACIRTLRLARQRNADNLEVLAALSDALCASQQYEEAVAILKSRLEREKDREHRLEILSQLGHVYENYVQDDDAAYETAESQLQIDDTFIDSLDRMERIDTRLDRVDKLSGVLMRRLNIGTNTEQALVRERLAHVWADKRGNVEKATDIYLASLDFHPDPESVLNALEGLYAGPESTLSLVGILEQRVPSLNTNDAKIAVYRSVGRLCINVLEDHDRSKAAWLNLLQLAEDSEALENVVVFAEQQKDYQQLQEALGRLAACTEDLSRKRDFFVRQSEVLSQHLARHADAAEVLTFVKNTLAAGNLAIFHKLQAAQELADDFKGLSSCLEEELSLIAEPTERLTIIRRLCDIYQHRLGDSVHAISFLYLWTELDPRNPEPWRRLLVLLDLGQDRKQLVHCIDHLVMTETDDNAISALHVRAADIEARELKDVPAAWARLRARAHLADGPALLAIEKLASEHGRQQELAELFTELATTDQAWSVRKARWLDAAKAHEHLLNDAGKALECVLEILSVEPENTRALDEIDRLAITLRDWERLTQIYQSLINHASSLEEQEPLVIRLSEVLEEASEFSLALSALELGSNIIPESTSIVEHAERLAQKSNAKERLFGFYERQRGKETQDHDRIPPLMKCVSLALTLDENAERASLYLGQAVALCVGKPDNYHLIEELLTAISNEHPKTKEHRPEHLLIEVYEKLATSSWDQSEASAELMARAARWYMSELRDPKAAFEAIRRAAKFSCNDQRILDDMEGLARENKDYKTLDADLVQLSKEALDKNIAVELLRRRAKLLEYQFEQFGKAADVYRQILAMKKGDMEYSEHLLRCLRKAEQYEDLLVEIHRLLQDAPKSERRLELLKQNASVWEAGLDNVREAINAWNQVLIESPGDTAAMDAIERLRKELRDSRPVETGQHRSPSSHPEDGTKT